MQGSPGMLRVCEVGVLCVRMHKHAQAIFKIQGMCSAMNAKALSPQAPNSQPLGKYTANHCSGWQIEGSTINYE